MRYLITGVFFAIVTAVGFGAHRYLWLRLVRDTALQQPWRGAVTVIIAALCAVMFCGPVVARLMGGRTGQWTATAAFTWMGAMFLALVSFGSADALRWFGQLTGVWADQEFSEERRLFFQRVISTSAASAAVVATGAGVHNARSDPQVTYVDVVIPRLPDHLDGFKIAQISDLHVSATIKRAYVERVVQLTNELEADFVALTGDLVDGSVDLLRDDFAPLAALQSTYGSFFCTGNHEYYSNADSWLAHVATLGIKPLRNQHTELGAQGEAPGLIVAGVDDSQAARFGGDHGQDVAKALRGVDPEKVVVLLAHQPKAIDEAAAHGVDLQLSGHTHGGQIWPFGYLVRLAQPYVAGLHRHGPRTQIYVNSGTGYWGPPIRLASQQEITCVTLRKQSIGKVRA